jgi:hypothetical protein
MEFRVETAQAGLRFVERKVKIGGEPRSIRILQQLWGVVVYPSSADAVANRNIVRVDQEWRDVPLVTEE